MKKVRKLLISLLLVVPVLSGCSTYKGDPSKKSDMVGTYKLQTITKNHNKKEDPYDYKSEIGAEAYFTLDIDGYVFYAYKDNNTPLTVTQAFAIYHHDIIEEDLYDSIKITDGITDVSIKNSEVGCMDEPTMGFVTNKNFVNNIFSKKSIKEGFNYTIPYEEKGGFLHPGQEYQYVYYEKISNDGSLSYLNSLLGTNYTFDRPFELQHVHGYYAYRAQKNGMENRDDMYFVRDYILNKIEKEIGDSHNILGRLSTEKYREKLNIIANSLNDEVAKGSSTVSEIIDIIVNGFNDIVENLNAADNTLNISKFDVTSIAQLKEESINELKTVYCDDSGNISTVDNIKSSISLILDFNHQNIAFGFGTISSTQYGVFENDEIEYAVIDTDSYSEGTFDLYYSEKAEPGMKKGSANITFVDNPEHMRTSVLTVFGKEYYCYNTGSLGYIFNDNVVYNPEDTYTSQEFSWVLDKEDNTIEDVLEALGVGQ